MEIPLLPHQKAIAQSVVPRGFTAFANHLVITAGAPKRAILGLREGRSALHVIIAEHPEAIGKGGHETLTDEEEKRLMLGALRLIRAGPGIRKLIISGNLPGDPAIARQLLAATLKTAAHNRVPHDVEFMLIPEEVQTAQELGADIQEVKDTTGDDEDRIFARWTHRQLASPDAAYRKHAEQWLPQENEMVRDF